MGLAASASALLAGGTLQTCPAEVHASRGSSSSRPLLQIAPMMDVTYKDFRQFMRLFTRRAQLWTEMWVDNTLCHAPRLDGFLDFGRNEHPIVCQLGGSNPETLARAAKIVESWGYDEVNLNCGCPSDRVCSKGEFGASLMKKPELVRECVRSMKEAVQVPVTVKCRLGVDDLDSPEFTANFVRVVAEGGVRHFIIHARKCILKGLTPDQNRKIPPLMYDRVFRLCRELPDLDFTLNGGITSLEEVGAVLSDAPPNLVGIMIGRAAMNNPCMLWDVDRRIYGAASNPSSAASRLSALSAFCAYLDAEHRPSETATSSGPLQGALKPVLGVFNGLRGNRMLRQSLDKLCREKGAPSRGVAAILRQVIDELGAEPVAGEHLRRPFSERHEGGLSC